MFIKLLYSLIRLLPFGRVPVALWLLRRGIYPAEKIEFKHADGFRMQLDLSDWVQLLIYLYGDYKYERNEIGLWKLLAKESSGILDIGSHVGYYSLLAASSNPDLEINSLEPTPKTYENLVTNVALNGFRIKTHNLALGDKKARATMMVPDERNTGMNFMSESEDETEGITEVTTLDLFFSGLNLSKDISLMKIDAEGSEHNILKGATAFIEKFKPIIFVELLNSTLNRFGSGAEQVYELMTGSGYGFYYMDSSGTFKKCKHGQEGEVLILVHESGISDVNRLVQQNG